MQHTTTTTTSTTTTTTTTNNHNHFTSLRPSGLCPVLPGWAGTRKVKPGRIYWSKR